MSRTIWHISVDSHKDIFCSICRCGIFVFVWFFAEHCNFHAHTGTPLWQGVTAPGHAHTGTSPTDPVVFLWSTARCGGAVLTRVLSSVPCTGPAKSSRTGCSPSPPHSPCPPGRACSRTAAAGSPGRRRPSPPPHRNSRTHWTRAPSEREGGIFGRTNACRLHACIHSRKNRLKMEPIYMDTRKPGIEPVPLSGCQTTYIK